MPLNIYQMGLALGVSKTWRDTLMEQLTGSTEEAEAFEISGSEEPQPMEKPSIKSRLLSGLVAQVSTDIYSTLARIIFSIYFPVLQNFWRHSSPSGVDHQASQVSNAA